MASRASRTRGLSITEWQPIVGTVPPLSDAAWQEAFAKYQQTPEYQQVNPNMTLAEFKPIFWMEWAHRLLGRLIGFAFLVPFLYFVVRRKLNCGTRLEARRHLRVGRAAGGNGLVHGAERSRGDDPRVSQYRLTAHLGLAFLIYGLMFWLALDVIGPRNDSSDPRLAGLRRFSAWLIGLIFGMVLTGGFVAGIRAGFAYNTFPLMNGHAVPPELFMLEPWWQNFFSNMATVQFDHRLLAWVLAFVVLWFWLRSRARTAHCFRPAGVQCAAALRSPSR